MRILMFVILIRVLCSTYPTVCASNLLLQLAYSIPEDLVQMLKPFPSKVERR
jgi:hypothetical protein